MRRRKDEFTSPSSATGSGGSSSLLDDNAFAPELFAELRERDCEPAVPEGELPGPWRVTRLWGDGPPLWAVYGLGERGPRLTFDDPSQVDLAFHRLQEGSLVLRTYRKGPSLTRDADLFLSGIFRLVGQ